MPKLEGGKAEFDIFERAISTAMLKQKLWWILVLPTLVKNDGDWPKCPDFTFFLVFF
jgi:hypothetical protein